MDSRIERIWKRQKHTPVVVRSNTRGERLRIRLPYSTGNRQWLRNGRRANPLWVKGREDNPGYWEIPKAWFNDFVQRALTDYGKVYIIQPYRAMEVCTPQCRNAVGHECECSCMGQYHGVSSSEGWFEVSDAFLFRWGPREVACRLLRKRK